VCLRNNSELGLLNGAIWHVVTIEEQSEEDRIRMVVKDERNNELAVEAHTQHFEGTEIPWFDKKKAQEFTYGYALTCHKSQGSQWDKVLVMDESRVFRDSRHRWLYTAITRAAQSVVVAV
jgi:exodeoxyribonuclease-5